MSVSWQYNSPPLQCSTVHDMATGSKSVQTVVKTATKAGSIHRIRCECQTEYSRVQYTTSSSASLRLDQNGNRSEPYVRASGTCDRTGHGWGVRTGTYGISSGQPLGPSDHAKPTHGDSTGMRIRRRQTQCVHAMPRSGSGCWSDRSAFYNAFSSPRKSGAASSVLYCLSVHTVLDWVLKSNSKNLQVLRL